LALAYRFVGDQVAYDRLIAKRPTLAAAVGDQLLAVENWVGAIGEYDKLIAGDTTDLHLLANRSLAHRKLGHLPEFATDYSRWVEHDGAADSTVWMHPAALWAYLGNTDRHREYCQKMAERYRLSANAEDTERLLKVMLLEANATELPPEAIEKFTSSLDVIPAGLQVWFYPLAALLNCRQGKYLEAHELLDKTLELEQASPNLYPKSLALAIQALTYANQRDVAKAQQSLDSARQVMSDGLKMSWQADGQLNWETVMDGTRVSHDKLIPEIICRETERLIRAENGAQGLTPPVGE
jgi:tetratricopeptide (TPR) repeat protein